MSFLNINIPPIECYIRKEFLRNQEDGHGEFFPCMIFGVSSLPSQVPLFHFLMEDGGVWWKMPIHAFASSTSAEPQELDELVLWDCFSYYVSVTKFYALENKQNNIYFSAKKLL